MQIDRQPRVSALGLFGRVSASQPSPLGRAALDRSPDLETMTRDQANAGGSAVRFAPSLVGYFLVASANSFLNFSMSASHLEKSIAPTAGSPEAFKRLSNRPANRP